MKRILHHLHSNLLLKIASFNSVAVLLRVLAGFVTSKAIAVFIGAEGLALIGNLRNFLTTIESFSTLGFSNGIVKYVAELKEDHSKLTETVITILIAVLIATLILSTLLYVYADGLSLFIFGASQPFGFIIELLAFALPFSSLNIVLVAIINGLSKYKTVVKINILSQVIGVSTTLFLIWTSQLEGALMAAVLLPGFLFFVTLFSFFQIKELLKGLTLSHLNIRFLKNLSAYSLMALFSAAVMPLVVVCVRNYLIDQVSLQDAGYWEAIRRISNYYVMFVSSLLALYILPRFAEITNAFEFRKEILHFYKTVLPVFALALIGIYIFRSLLVQLIFTEDFLPVTQLFKWQLLGDFLKVISSVIAYQLIAKKMVYQYIGIELFSMLSLYVSSMYLIDWFGVEGAVMAHFVNFALHALVILMVFRKELFSRENFNL